MLFLICLVVTVALVLTYNLTKDKIEERAMLDSENAKREVLGDMDKFENIDNIDLIKEEILKNDPDKGSLRLIKEAYIGIKSGQEHGYVFLVTVNGYGCEIDLMIGINMDGKITGVKVIKHSETPGLGSKATNDDFLSQFIDITPTENLNVIKGQKTKPEEISAVSGATISSRAIASAVQSACDMAAELNNMKSESSAK